MSSAAPPFGGAGPFSGGWAGENPRLGFTFYDGQRMTSTSSDQPVMSLEADTSVSPDAAMEVSDELLLLGERTAVQRYFDEHNVRRLRLVLWFFVVVMAGYALGGFVEGRPLRGAVALVIVLGDLLLLRGRTTAFMTTSVRQAAAVVMLGHFFLLQVFHFDSTGAVVLWFLLFPILAARFRLADGEILALYGSLLAVLVLRLTIEVVLTRQGVPFGRLIGYGLWFAVVCLVAWRISRRAETRFLARWRRETGRHRERLRMKQELEYARQIQLSMLPREAPSLSWADIAALSLPATEVGGDYYDYFRLEDGRLAVVIGDVTGHGVASGLVLSGVRSSLNLLSDELDRPAEVLDRLNRMLKRTSTPRMLMTLAVAVLDPAGRLTVASAGHPPAMVVATGGGPVREVGKGALPLGAISDAGYAADSGELAPGDVILLYSDGLVETPDESGRLYGYVRLREILAREAERSSARAVRDAILRDVWEFKGDADQLDDITMVVIRVVGAQDASVANGQEA